MPAPTDYQGFLALSPADIEGICQELAERPLDAYSIEGWLADWAHLGALFQECLARYDVATAVNTADEDAQQRVTHYRETIWPIGHRMNQQLSQRMEAHADLLPPDLRAVQARQQPAEHLNSTDAALDLLNREAELINQYEAIIGAQTVEWEGEVLPAHRMRAVLEEADPLRRERAWRAIHERRWQDRDAINRLWAELLDVRDQLATENGFDDYLSYRWVELSRTDYTPADSQALHAAILRHWAPLHSQLMAEQRQRLTLDVVHPWSAEVPVESLSAKPFSTTTELLDKVEGLFQRMDPDFAAYVARLREMGFIELSERANTGSMGGFSRAIGRHGNFIFLNVQGGRIDVENLVHELGHALAMRASCQLPYMAYWGFPSDFSETPSTVMEMMSQPYWDAFYAAEDLSIARCQYFQSLLKYGLNCCLGDAFQHWAYRHPAEARDPEACDAMWHHLRQSYLPGIDYTGVEALHGVGWQRMMLNFYLPLFSMEYVYGQVAGLQLLPLIGQDPATAVARYKSAIALGNSTTTRALFAAIGLIFPIDETTVASAAHIIAPYLA